MRTLVCTCLFFLAAVIPALPQEGHPLSGTWTGDWGASAISRNHLTVVLNWDGKAITGILNPGPGSSPLQNVALDVTNWTVRLEADAKDAAGAAVHIAAEGRLQDLGSIHRTIKGNWKQGTVTGDFRLTRD